MIDFDKITFSNNYMFNTVMTRKELCRKCLERILGKNITDISIPDSEKWIGPSIAAKSIRLYDAVIDIRKDKRWRKRIMTLDQYAKEQAELKKDDWIAEGIEQGQALATDRMNILISKLLETNRTDELAASAKDPELQKALLKEFGLL